MYLPEHFNENDEALVMEMIEQQGFGSLITAQDRRPFVSHIPMFAEKKSQLYILGHLANANAQLEQLDNNPNVLVTFQGPHCYISPGWYESPGVPTWNYVAIHCYGTGRLIHDRERTRYIIETLTRQYEQSQDKPWQADYPDRMLDAISGFEIEVTAMQCKFKLSQNRSTEDRDSIIRQLDKSTSSQAQGVKTLMQRLRDDS
jgi:transcriptional regulator